MVDKEFSTENYENDLGSASQDFGIDDGEPLAIEEYSEGQKPAGGLKKALKRIMIGLVLVLLGAGTYLLSDILGAGDEIVAITPSPIKSENNNKLVYVTGTPEQIQFSDPIFSVSVNGLGLTRVVEMYQWAHENGEYVKKWSEEIINIQEPDAISKGFVNPPELPFISEKWPAEKIMLGSFVIAKDLFQKIGAPQPLPLTDNDFKKLDPEGQLALKLSDGAYFFGINPAKPNIGDLRISFKTYAAAPITILAKQSGESLEPYLGKNGVIGIIRPGNVDLAVLKQTIDLGNNSTITFSLIGLAALLAIVGIVVMIGKNPFSRKGSKVIKAKSVNNKKIISKKAAAIEEDVVLTDELEDAALSADVKEDFVSPPPQNKYVQKAPDLSAFNIPEKSSQIMPPPALKVTAPPAPLEFTSEPANQEKSPDITSRLQQFGVIDEPAVHMPTNLAVQENIADIHEHTDVAEQNYDHITYDNEMSLTEDMPFEVEVLSEDDMELHEPEAVNIPAPNQVNLAMNNSIADTKPQDIKINNNVLEPYAPQENTGLQLDELPHEVELISESESFADEQPYEHLPPPKALAAEPYGIDFYPDRADISVDEEITPNNDFAQPQIDNLEDANSENIQSWNEPDAEIQTFSGSDNWSTAEEIHTDDNIDEDEEYYEEPMPAPAPQPLEFTNDLPFAPVVPQQAATNEQILPPPPPLPPTPNFDSLFASAKAARQKQAAESKPEAKPESSMFDLPNIPSDFDPNAEMHYGISDDENNDSPFGDDPFAHQEEKK